MRRTHSSRHATPMMGPSHATASDWRGCKRSPDLSRTMRIDVAVIAITTALLFPACGSREEEEENPVVTVDVAPVLSSEIQRVVRAPAVVYPLQQAAIVPKITAPIRKFYVERGATVKAGQLLVELENGELAGVASETEAAYQAALATYETTARATVPEDAQKAELEVQTSKTAMDAAQAVFENRERLFQEGAIAQKDVNDSRVAFTQAKQQYEMAQKRL